MIRAHLPVEIGGRSSRSGSPSGHSRRDPSEFVIDRTLGVEIDPVKSPTPDSARNEAGAFDGVDLEDGWRETGPDPVVAQDRRSERLD